MYHTETEVEPSSVWEVWMNAQTTQVLVLIEENLGVYYFLINININVKPPKSSQVGLIFLGLLDMEEDELGS